MNTTELVMAGIASLAFIENGPTYTRPTKLNLFPSSEKISTLKEGCAELGNEMTVEINEDGLEYANSLSKLAVIAAKTPRSKSANSIKEALGL